MREVSNKTSSRKTEKQRQKKPGSTKIAGKSVIKGQGSSKVKAQQDSQGPKAIKITKKSLETVPFALKPEFLPPDMWKEISALLPAGAQLNLAAVSKDFNEISEIVKDTDLKKLEEFRKTHQWTFKDECAMRILVFVARLSAYDIPIPTIEKLKKTSTLNIKTNITSAEALKQIDKFNANYEKIQSVYNELLSNMRNWVHLTITPFLALVIPSAASMIGVFAVDIVISSMNMLSPARDLALVLTSLLVTVLSMWYISSLLLSISRATIERIADEISGLGTNLEAQ